MTFSDRFGAKKPVIACVHLLPLPGAPRFAGSGFKKGGKRENLVEKKRVKAFMRKSKSLSGARLK